MSKQLKDDQKAFKDVADESFPAVAPAGVLGKFPEECAWEVQAKQAEEATKNKTHNREQSGKG